METDAATGVLKAFSVTIWGWVQIRGCSVDLTKVPWVLFLVQPPQKLYLTRAFFFSFDGSGWPLKPHLPLKLCLSLSLNFTTWARGILRIWTSQVVREIFNVLKTENFILKMRKLQNLDQLNWDMHFLAFSLDHKKGQSEGRREDKELEIDVEKGSWCRNTLSLTCLNCTA